MVWALRAVDPALGMHSFNIRSLVLKVKSSALPNPGTCERLLKFTSMMQDADMSSIFQRDILSFSFKK